MPERSDHQHDRKDEAESPETRCRNMHENVEADEDEPCVCSAEPRWQALGEEMEREKQESQEARHRSERRE